MMDDGCMFNIIFYNHDVSNDTILDPEKMLKLDDKTRKQAYEFIDKLDPIGHTNIFDPMEIAFKFSSLGSRGGKLSRAGVDTIFLLTDGLPNRGQVPRAEDIVVKIREMNKSKKIKINTIGVFSTEGIYGGEYVERGRKFLKELAEDSGGIFKSPPPKRNK
jgi:hypothetical protein